MARKKLATPPRPTTRAFRERWSASARTARRALVERNVNVPPLSEDERKQGLVRTTIRIEMTIDHDSHPADVRAAVNHVLDAGVLQDAVLEILDGHGNAAVCQGTICR